MKKGRKLLYLATLKGLLGFLLLSHLPLIALAQQPETQDPTENSGGVIQPYGRNAATNLDSV